MSLRNVFGFHGFNGTRTQYMSFCIEDTFKSVNQSQNKNCVTHMFVGI